MDTETKKLKILIVDNHAELVKQIKARLSMEEDFEVCRVAPLDSMTEAILECQPDLLLIDPYFEQSYKYDHLKMARQLVPSLMIVVLTAVVDTAAAVRFKKEGVHCVLEKGVNSSDLVESLRKVIQEACSSQKTIENEQKAQI